MYHLNVIRPLSLLCSVCYAAQSNWNLYFLILLHLCSDASDDIVIDSMQVEIDEIFPRDTRQTEKFTHDDIYGPHFVYQAFHHHIIPRPREVRETLYCQTIGDVIDIPRHRHVNCLLLRMRYFIETKRERESESHSWRRSRRGTLDKWNGFSRRI